MRSFIIVKYMCVVLLIEFTVAVAFPNEVNYFLNEGAFLQTDSPCPQQPPRSPTHAPEDLPHGIDLHPTDFLNWVGAIKVNGLWTMIPKSVDDIVDLVNWAYDNDYQVRPSGFMHTWSPLTVEITSPEEYDPDEVDEIFTNETITTQSTICSNNSRVILIKTNETLSQVKMLSENTYPFPAAWVQSGATLEAFLDFLEKNGYGIDSHPAIGEITMGGIMAIAGHGTGTNTKNSETNSYYGSVSSLIVAFTAIVWDEDTYTYVLKQFTRDDPDFSAIVVTMGRTIVLEMVLKVAPLTYLRCQSIMTIPTAELLANPEEKSSASNEERSIEKFLDSDGIVEIIAFPFTSFPWLKVWSIEPEKPQQSKQVSSPYNYPFADTITQEMSDMFAKMILGNWEQTLLLGKAQNDAVEAGLVASESSDLWGPSKNLLLYAKATTLRLEAMALCILTSKNSVQRVLYEAYTMQKELIEQYAAEGKYPINGPLEIRISEVDSSDEFQAPGISPSTPSSGNLDFNCSVWFNLMTIPGTPLSAEFYNTLENQFYTTFDGSYAVVRPEWSKDWAYNDEGAWKDEHKLTRKIPESFDLWERTTEAFCKYDPYSVVTNDFLSYLFGHCEY